MNRLFLLLFLLPTLSLYCQEQSLESRSCPEVAPKTETQNKFREFKANVLALPQDKKPDLEGRYNLVFRTSRQFTEIIGVTFHSVSGDSLPAIPQKQLLHWSNENLMGITGEFGTVHLKFMIKDAGLTISYGHTYLIIQDIKMYWYHGDMTSRGCYTTYYFEKIPPD